MADDGEGVRSNNNTFWAHFDVPQYTVAADHPGTIQFQLFWHGTLIYTSSTFVPPGISGFAGLVSDQPFDAVFIYRNNSDYVYMDDFHFGVPSPGALGVSALAVFGCRMRER